MARDKMITIRVDEAERSLFNEAARAVGISVSEYARDAMLARMLLAQEQGVVEPRIVRREGVAVEAPRVISSSTEVPAAVERVAPARTFTPFSKEQQTGKAAKKTKPTVEVKSCRHGLLRCKVCETG